MKDKLSLVAIATVLVVSLVWYIFPDYILSRFGDVSKAGAYGDIFGAVNALFTSLAFALLIYTALMQREELKLQREELMETRKELARSAKSQEELVKFTKESLEFQKYTRKSQIWPEFSVVSGLIFEQGVPAPYERIKEIYLEPLYAPVRFVNAAITPAVSGVELHGTSVMEKSGKIINVSERVYLSVRYTTASDLIGLKIEVIMSDIDNSSFYLQRIVVESESSILITTADEIPYELFDEYGLSFDSPTGLQT